MKVKSPLKAIRNMCMQCNGGPENNSWASETKNCVATTCAIYEFRSGHNPYLKRELSDEQRKELADNARTIFNRDRDRESAS